MAWVNWPAVAGSTDVQKWDWIIQLWRACREKAWAMGNEFWPGVSHVYLAEDRPTSYTDSPQYTGVVDSIGADGDDYVLADGGRTFIEGFVDPGANPHAPTSWDVVIEHSETDPWGVVRTQVTANTEDTITLAGGPLDDAVTAGQIPSVSALAGKKYCLVRRHSTSHPSLHWHERWLPWPNAAEYANGQSSLSTAVSLTDATANWHPNAHAGRELMTLAGGRLARIAIVGNTRDTLTFGTQPVAPDVGADYAVIDPGEVWAYGRPRPAPWRWYGGFDYPTAQALVDPRFYSHWPDGTLQPTPTAAPSIVLEQMNAEGTFCEVATLDVFDRDFWTGLEDECTAPDRPHAPEFYFALRGLQVDAEDKCTSFIEAKNHDNLYADPDPEKSVPNFVPATWLKAAGVNHYTTTVSSATVSGTPHITFPAITLPAGVISGEVLPLLVHYAILDTGGAPIAYGYSTPEGMFGGVYGGTLGTLVSTTRIDLRGPTQGEAQADPSPYPPDQEWADTWVGKSLVISLRWSRYHPREFRYFYDKTVCIDDGVDTSFYLTRPKSTAYVEAAELGTSLDSGTPAFVDGDLARYVGDNAFDPTTDDSVDNGLDPDTVTRDRLFTGKAYPSENEWGYATGGSTRSLQDTTRSEKARWWPEGAIRTETGTATSGGTTTLSDTTKASNAFWDGTTGRWAGFVVEVNIGGTWHRRPIASHTVGSQTLAWDEPLPASASGRPYRIREPGELNRWKGRAVRFWIAGERYTRTVTYSDDDTLYFADTVAVLPGTPYQILEARTGQVWKWEAASSAWVKPAGSDPRGGTFHPDQRKNAPTVVRRFGRVRRNDYTDYRVLNQLYAGINALRWTKAVGYWDGVPGHDFQMIDTQLATIRADSVSWPDIIDEDTDFFNAGFYANYSSLLVPHSGTLTLQGSGSKGVRQWSAQGSAFLDNVETTRIKHASDAYVFTSTDEDDSGFEPDHETSGTVPVTFDAQGYNVYFRKWSKIAGTGPTFDSSDAIMVGDKTASPPNFDEPASGTVVRAWSVVGMPVIVHRWDVEGGMVYVD